jgi:L-alanine-DL-glutamate epimerase-like enolase superfamily enzyme
MKITHEVVSLRTTHPFVIARGGASEYRVVLVRLTDGDGADGIGEASPSRFYGETADTVQGALAQFAPVLEKADAWSIETIEAELTRVMRYNAAAKSAVSGALHDLMGKRLGVPLYKLWGLDPRRAPLTSFTIGIGDAAELRRKVTEAAQYPVLKVKLGSDRDEEIIRTIREAAPDKTLRVDANAAWSPKHALNMIELLAELGVEFVEQPVPAHAIEGLRFVRERSPLPVIADESCVVLSDVPRMAGVVDGINIKIAKCGGLKQALKMIAAARAHDLLVMMGCMIETTVGIAQAAHMASLLDYADLDGAALLANDPFRGVSIGNGTIALSGAAGLGVERT